ncbi:MAG TPA: hypothetical protein VFM68_04555 [Candidatus Saccharimonadales bacterium]|nr:hypothetical protein [Candidatus Saccharimonadales bacterium]
MSRQKRVHEKRAQANVIRATTRLNIRLTTSPFTHEKDDIDRKVRRQIQEVKKVEFPTPQLCVVTITGCDPVSEIRTQVELILQKCKVRP